jgi:hypothetical protein
VCVDCDTGMYQHENTLAAASCKFCPVAQ